MIDKRVWDDQADFNETLRPTLPIALSQENRISLTKDFALHMVTEISEMMAACGTWEMHRRRRPVLVNEENVRRQLIDQFKYWMTICQLWGFTLEEMESTYWRKSATVRARYSEEFLLKLDRPACILDLDNVLADYSTGFANWACMAIDVEKWGLRDAGGVELCDPNALIIRIRQMERARVFFSAENAGVDLADWMRFQHAFRVRGGFAHLPPCDGLKEFVAYLRSTGLSIIGLTSRSIDTYPNIIDDTLHWLSKHGVHMDCVWWGSHKGEKLKEAMPDTKFVQFVVDDDPRYLPQYAQLGIERIYWVKGMPGRADYPGVIPVSGLTDIIALEMERAQRS